MPRICERKILCKLPGIEKLKKIKKAIQHGLNTDKCGRGERCGLKKYPDKCGLGLGFESASFWNTEMVYYYK